MPIKPFAKKSGHIIEGEADVADLDKNLGLGISSFASNEFANLHLIFLLNEVRAMKRESKFQSELKKEINERLPGCMILKNDPTHMQGIPDLLILYEDSWAALECKRHEGAKHQPNQDYYVEKMNGMSYASFIYPENKGAVLDAMESTLRSKSRRTRISRSQQVSLAKLRRPKTG